MIFSGHNADQFAILDHSTIGHFVLNSDYRVLFWNRCLEGWTGITKNQIVNRSILDYYPYLDGSKYRNRIEDYVT